MVKVVENCFNLVLDPRTFRHYVSNTPIIRLTKSGKRFKDYSNKRRIQAHEFKDMTREELISELTGNGYQLTHIEAFIQDEGIEFKE